MSYESLRADLEYITRQRPLPEEDTMLKLLNRLDQLAETPNLPKQLAHYLSKRSYVKALAWLDNPETPHHS